MPRATGGRSVTFCAVDQDVALGDRLVPGDHAQRAGLAAAARAQQAAVAGGGMRSEIASTATVCVVALGDGDQLDIEPRLEARRVIRGGLIVVHCECSVAPARRFWMWKMRHKVRPMIRNDTAVVTVPIANSIGEVALEISA